MSETTSRQPSPFDVVIASNIGQLPMFIGAEIGLPTPPLGIPAFAVKSPVEDRASLGGIFAGAFPVAANMLLVLVATPAFPVVGLAHT